MIIDKLRAVWYSKLRHHNRVPCLELTDFAMCCHGMNMTLYYKDDPAPYVVPDVLNIIVGVNNVSVIDTYQNYALFDYPLPANGKVIELRHNTQVVTVIFTNTITVAPKDMADNTIYVGVQGIAKTMYRIEDQVHSIVVSGKHRNVGEPNAIIG